MRNLARAAFRRLIEPALLAAGVDRARRATLGGRVLVLAYHNIVPQGERPVGDRSLHLPQRAFAEQLDVLTETHDVVPLSRETLFAVTGGRPRVVITFDDAYRGALTAGIDEISSRKLPATVFVAPGIIGKTMWWDMFADPVSGELDGRFRNTALSQFAGMNDDVIALASREGRRPVVMPDWARIGGEADLAHAATQTGMSFGAHSWSHANLSALAEPELLHELRAPIGWLGDRFGNTFVPWLAWPYGLRPASAGAAAVREQYQGAFLVSGGYVSRDGPRHSAVIPRFNVPSGISLNAFTLRAAGLFTRK